MAEVQTNLLERVRNGLEHHMIKAIIKNVFQDQHRQSKIKPKTLTNDEILEISVIHQRLLQLNLINSASVLQCETSKNLYPEEVLKEVVNNYCNGQSLASAYEVKEGQKLPEATSKLSAEKTPMVPVSTPKDLRLFREKTNEEMVESRKLLHSRKPFREDDEEDIDDDEEDDEHTNDDKELTDEEENDDYDENSHVPSKVTDDTITSSSSSDEEITTEWTKTLLSAPPQPSQTPVSKPSKEVLPTFPSLSLQRLPPIIRPPANSFLPSNEDSPATTDSERMPDEKKESIIERHIDSKEKEDDNRNVEEISGELEELNFDDVSGGFSDSAESISF